MAVRVCVHVLSDGYDGYDGYSEIGRAVGLPPRVLGASRSEESGLQGLSTGHAVCA